MRESYVDTDIRILADHGNDDYFTSLRRSIKLSHLFPLSILTKVPGGQMIIELIWGIKCWLLSLNYSQSIPIITVGHGHGFVFALLQYVFRPVIKPRTHIMFDFLLSRKGRGLATIYESIKFRIFRSVVDLAIVWGESDIKNFAEEYDLPSNKLLFHPHHITLERYTFDISDKGFIFAGGNSVRDYYTLIEAVKTIDYPVFIATTLSNVAALAKEYDHITVKGVSHEEFRSKMAACTIFVETHDSDILRTTGHQTFLNAMWMGKPVVMADKKSAVGYFDEGVDGLIVPAGDSTALRKAIQSLLNDPDKACAIGEKAKEKIHHPIYKTLNCMQSIYNIALEISCKKCGLKPDQKKIEMY